MLPQGMATAAAHLPKVRTLCMGVISHSHDESSERLASKEVNFLLRESRHGPDSQRLSYI
jgi:hypothetical protein